MTKRHGGDHRDETPGAARNRERRADGKAPIGRPPKPSSIPKTPVEADDDVRYPDEDDYR